MDRGARAVWAERGAPFYDGPIDKPEDGPEGRTNGWPLDEFEIDYTRDTPSSGLVNDTSVAGVKTSATTAIEGVKTFGSSTVGLVEGGKDEARARWKAGARETKHAAGEGGAQTKRAADVPRCR